MMTDQEAKKAISEYMIKMNRPYSVQNIIDNMQGRVKKTSAQTILDKLSDEGVLKCKEYGKAKIYLANQDNFPEVSNEELA
jgi:26S proteasome regulatory subunit (ATPase 3-interacting protein)